MSPSLINPEAWSQVDTVQLDLDGTLLDLAFDNYFWRERVPAAWAQARGLSLAAARQALEPQFRAREGTLEWYCVEFWSRELGLDIAALTREAAAGIEWLPGAQSFLRRVRAAGKRLVLLTNSHPKALAIKDARTQVTAHFHASISSHSLGAPKEDARFWQSLQRLEPFDPARTVFVDDSPAVLRAAQRAGIRHVIGVRRPDSAGAEREHTSVAAIGSVAELLVRGP